MPEALERKLKAQAAKKGFGKERTDAYVYETMRKTGWKPSTQKNPVISPTLTGASPEAEKMIYKKGKK